MDRAGLRYAGYMPIDSIDAFLLGLPAIDDDHRRLVAAINRIGLDLREASYSLALELFEELEREARAHFDREEDLLERHGYPEVARHRRYHAELLERVAELKRLGYQKADKQALVARYSEMADFVVDDIIRGDLELREWLSR
jgi:hemerythrin